MRDGGEGKPSAFGSKGSDGAVGFCENAFESTSRCCCIAGASTLPYEEPYRSYTGFATLYAGYGWYVACGDGIGESATVGNVEIAECES